MLVVSVYVQEGNKIMQLATISSNVIDYNEIMSPDFLLAIRYNIIATDRVHPVIDLIKLHESLSIFGIMLHLQ